MTEGTALVEISGPHDLSVGDGQPPALFLKEARAAERFFDFFTANIRNKHTRRAYYNAASKFSEFFAQRGVHDLAQVKPVHVAGYIESLLPGFAKPTIKQHLAAIRMLFDWLVIGQIMDVNPAHAVRGPKHVVTKGRTPVLNREEARALLSSIDASTLTGLRDRALIGIMIYTFARVGAVLQMNVGDYFSQGRHEWVRLHEKGGKEHEAPCVPKLEDYLDAYIVAAGIGDDKDGPLFRTTGRFTGTPHRMTQQDGHRMIGRRARHAGIKTRIGNHSMLATGIIDYQKSDGTLEHAQTMAAHSSPRTTKLNDRRSDETALDEYEKVRI
jgi:site-specific recombinase XerD